MQDILSTEQAKKIASFNSIDIYHIYTEKFKTNTINIYFSDNLNNETATKNALIPALLRRGCESYPTFQEIALYLEELYGASFDCGVSKKGERQIIQFYMEFVSDRFTVENSNLFEKAFNLLYEIITKPITEKGYFKKEYLEQEKENLKRLIESRVNDKAQYAVERCFEEMCKGEPFEVFEYGAIKDLALIEGEKLYEYYRQLLETLPIQVFITGKVDEDKLKDMINKLSGLKRGRVKNIDNSRFKKEIKEITEITEKMSINQGKLSLGFRTNINPGDSAYYTMLVYNGILGGGIHSKLFQNVREKASLAYYAFSRIEKFKGLMVISSGIEIENKDKALKIIYEQLDEIKKGNISDNEYDSTIKTIETGINSLRDSQIQIVDFYLSQLITASNDTFDSIIDKVKRVSKQDVVDISHRIELDTVYFLTSNS